VPSAVMEGAVLRPWRGMCAGRGQLGGGGGIDCTKGAGSGGRVAVKGGARFGTGIQ
jgi:hypothetical protein